MEEGGCATESPPAVEELPDATRTEEPASLNVGDIFLILGDGSRPDVTTLENPDFRLEGSDSGVEAGSGREATPGVSCDSSLLSCCSDNEEPTPLTTTRSRKALGSPAKKQAPQGKRRSEPVSVRTVTPPARLRSGTASPSVSTTSQRARSGSTTPRQHTPTSSKPAPTSAFGRCATATQSRRDKTPVPASTTRRTSAPPAPTASNGAQPRSSSRSRKATTPTTPPPTSDIKNRSIIDTYATLPRRRRRSPSGTPATTPTFCRSLSASREPGLTRAASLRKQHNAAHASRSLPPYPRRRYRQEAAAQTDAKELAAVEVQHLEAKVRLLTEGQALLQADCDRQRHLLHQETATRLAREEELARTIERVQALLGTHADEDSGSDSLQELEIRVQTSGHILIKQQQEITELQSLCRILQKDLDKSLAAQKTLLQQHQELEAESLELQEFLQAEKSTLSDSLREAEVEIQRLNERLLNKEAELAQQQDECKHLVRISEQRRQECMAMQAKLGGLGTRSKELLLQQGAAVSGASVALSGLSSRLDALVEQLVSSYNISEKDLEDVIFHNEAYSKSNSSTEASPEKTAPIASPKRNSSSFVAAVIMAIRNATGAATGKVVSPPEESVPETEPEISQTESKEQADLPEQEPRLVNSRSIQNLSQAILIRQQSEQDYGDIEELLLGDYNPSAVSLVDQIIEVDNLVTKLLKVLRIIQLDTDTFIDELQDERETLAKQMKIEQEDRQESTHNWEITSCQLRNELAAAREQLRQCTAELERTKNLQQQGRQERLELLRQWLSASSSKLSDIKEQQLAGIAMQEVQRQYEAIDGALETLQGIQGIVMQCPSLTKLQQDLEETNFRCITTLPLVGADLNANAALVTNGTLNGGTNNVLDSNQKSMKF